VTATDTHRVAEDLAQDALVAAAIGLDPRGVAGRCSQSRGGGGDGVGAGRGVALVEALAGYHLLPAVRGDLLVKLGRFEEARAGFERAASLTQNARERELLLRRAAACAGE
jgi:hypothetical protein